MTELAHPLRLAENVQAASVTAEHAPGVLDAYLRELPDADRVRVLTEIAHITGIHTTELVRGIIDPNMDSDTQAAVRGLSRTVQQRATWVASTEINLER